MALDFRGYKTESKWCLMGSRISQSKQVNKWTGTEGSLLSKDNQNEILKFVNFTFMFCMF
jgi:hypothetical protein